MLLEQAPKVKALSCSLENADFAGDAQASLAKGQDLIQTEEPEAESGQHLDVYP